MISRQEVEHIARLARLHFEEEEVVRLQAELSQVLDYAQPLVDMDLSGVEPTARVVDLKNVFRPDEPEPSLPLDEVLADAPEVEKGHFVVPRIG